MGAARWSILAVLLAANCGGGSGQTSAGGSPGTGGSSTGGTTGSGGTFNSTASAADFGPAFEAALCAPRVACGYYPNVATCEAVLAFAETADLLTVVADVGRGTVRYDAAAAAACVGAVPADCATTFDSGKSGARYAEATDVFLSISACFQVFQGVVADGAACTSSFECGTGSTCSGTACGTTQCCRATCSPLSAYGPGILKFSTPVALGGDCTNAPCAPPAVCQGQSLNVSTCVIPPSEGDACVPGAAVPCRTLDDYCDATTMVCTRRLATGAPCASAESVYGDPCIGADWCTGTASGILTCLPPPAQGDPCDHQGQCLNGLDCDVTRGQCVDRTAGVDCGPA